MRNIGYIQRYRTGCKGLSEPLCILFSDTKGIQWVGTNAGVSTEPVPVLWYGLDFIVAFPL